MTEASIPPLESIEFLIDATPVAKGRPRLGKYGAYTPDKTRLAEKKIKSLSLKYAPKLIPNDPVRLTIIFWLDKPKSSKRRHPVVKPDIDNFCKLLCDSFNGLFWKDDSQIIHLDAKKAYNNGLFNAGIYIRIDYLDPALSV